MTVSGNDIINFKYASPGVDFLVSFFDNSSLGIVHLWYHIWSLIKYFKINNNDNNSSSSNNNNDNNNNK